MNNSVTSREEILEVSRELIRSRGWASVNIRSVAAACGVAVGSIYNYFESKSELTGAVVESIWREIFHRPEDGEIFRNTLSCIRWMYGRMEQGNREYPGFFSLHSMGFLEDERDSGKELMQRTWMHIHKGLCLVLSRDEEIRADAFNESFTAEKFAGTLFSLLLSAMLKRDFDPETVLEVTRRTLY